MEKVKKTQILRIHNSVEEILYFLYSVFPQFKTSLNGSFPNGISAITIDELSLILSDSNKDMVHSITFMKQILDKSFLNHEVITIVIENNYVDRVYRDCYYTHFSGKHFEYSRYCKRVLLFQDDQVEAALNLNKSELNESFLGSIVVKPIKHGAIGRTLLSPSVVFSDGTINAYIRISEYEIHFCGISLKIKAFPFSMQDKETLSCAEITILNIMDYYSNKYSDYKYTLPSDIYNVLNNSGFERPLPTTGMSYTMISRLLFEFGFFPKLYVANEGYSDEQMRRILSYYVESAIPVAVGLRYDAGYNHSIICIGHGKTSIDEMTSELYRTFESGEGSDEESLYVADTANAHSEIIVMDDNMMPYSTYQFCLEEKSIYSVKDNGLSFGRKISNKSEKDSKIVCIAVPLYKRMYMDAESARNICIEVLKDRKISFKNSMANVLGKTIGSKESPVVMRLFLASSKTFLADRIESTPRDSALRKIYKSTYFPRFIWVCELYDVENYADGYVLGEIILDATASITENPFDSVISIFYPDLLCLRAFDGKMPKEIFKAFLHEEEIPSQGNEIDFIRVKAEQKIWDSPIKMFSSNLDPVRIKE